MVSRYTLKAAVEAAVMAWLARHRTGLFVLAAGAVAGFLGGVYLNLTGFGSILLSLLASPFAYLLHKWAASVWWTRNFRRLLAADSLPYPGKKEAKAWRKREKSRIATLRVQSPVAFDAHGVTNRAKVAPGLQQVRSVSNADIRFKVEPARIGVKDGVKKLQSNAHDIGVICGAKDMIVKPMGDGSAWCTLIWTERMAQTLPIQMLGEAPPNRLAFSHDEDDDVVSIMMQSVYINGMTGLGKSGILWDLITDCQRKVRWHAYVLDAKGGQELGMFKPHVGQVRGRMTVKDWVGSIEDAPAMIHEVEARMKERQGQLIGVRKWTQDMSDEYPLIMLVVDEALELMLKIDKVSRDKLLTIASQGRAAGVMVVLLSQLPNKEILGLMRGVIAQRISLGTESAIDTGMVFGDPSAEEKGARCSEISTPGIGYVRIEGERGYKMFRAAYVDDDDIDQILNSDDGLPEGMSLGKAQKSELYAVYRYRTSDQQILYVGITNDFGRRDREHRTAFEKGEEKHYWYAYVDPTQTYITAADNKEQAKAVESKEIAAWHPVGNTAENADNPRQGLLPVQPLRSRSRFRRGEVVDVEPPSEPAAAPTVVPISRPRRRPRPQVELEPTGTDNHYHGGE